MEMKFEVTIDADEATPYELEEAIRDTLRVLDLPNGDTLYIDYPGVDYKLAEGR